MRYLQFKRQLFLVCLAQVTAALVWVSLTRLQGEEAASTPPREPASPVKPRKQASAERGIEAQLPLRLLNVDFANRLAARQGPAAIGLRTNDVWNSVVCGWRTFGSLTNLLWSDGTMSGAQLTVENAPGEWANEHPDPMFASYIYPHDGGNISVMVSGLSPGVYDLFLYGHGGLDHQAENKHQQNSIFSVSVPQSEVEYPEQATTTTDGWLSPEWKEGHHYVVIRGVTVQRGSVHILVKPGASTYAILAGLQIAQFEALPANRSGGDAGYPGGTAPSGVQLRNEDLSTGVLEEEVSLDLEAAAKSYQELIDRFDQQRPAAAAAVFRLAECYRKLGRLEEAKTQYARILREFPDQSQFTVPSQKILFGNPEGSGKGERQPTPGSVRSNIGTTPVPSKPKPKTANGN